MASDPHDEVGRAQDAAASLGLKGVFDAQPQETIFGKILKKEIPADVVYEDDKVIERLVMVDKPKRVLQMHDHQSS